MSRLRGPPITAGRALARPIRGRLDSVLARRRAEAPRSVARDVEEDALARRGGAGAEDWAGWWRAVRDDAELHDAVAERDRRGVDHPERSERSPEVHEAALRAAGFRGIEVLWRKGTDTVLAALS